MQIRFIEEMRLGRNNMKEKIYYDGSNYEEFEKSFLVFFDEENVQKVLEIINDYKSEILDDEEKFTIEQDATLGVFFEYNKTISQTHYHINIKKITIVCLQILLEMIFQSIIKESNINEQEIPIVSTFLELKKCFSKLHEENGEICIAMEIQCNSEGFTGWNSIESNKGECINNHLSCSYNCEGKCKLKKDEFQKIIESLVQREIICNKNNKYRITI